MLFIWQGKGWIVLLVIFMSVLAGGFLTNVVTGSPLYGETHSWPTALSLLVAALLCWFVGKELEAEKARELLDAETGEKVTLRARHHLFWIPVKWWALVAVALAILSMVAPKGA